VYGIQLSKIETDAFKDSGLIGIVIPASVQILGQRCFLMCQSLSSVQFESGSILSEIGNWALYDTGLIDIVLPVSVAILEKRLVCQQ
jgi:hypothetical protein